MPEFSTASNRPTRLALAGAGAFGAKHLAALSRISDVGDVVLVEPDRTKVDALGQPQVAGVVSSLDDVLSDESVDGVILATPTPIHSAQAVACLEAGKHVQVEIPVAESLDDAEAVARAQQASGRIAMVGHTRRFNPSHQFIHHRVLRDEFHLRHLVAETFFFRRENLNARGEPRSWTDNLLWHHAAHTIDLFRHQTQSRITAANILAADVDPTLGIPLDMSIQLKTASGSLCTLALSFNNDGPFGTTFRYIGDSATYVARYDELIDGYERPVDLSGVAVSNDGIELQDREFVEAIREGREPEASIRRVLPCYRVLGELQKQLSV